MSEISCGEKLNALNLCPAGESIEHHITGRGSGKLGVDVKVRDVFHRG
jgi:hypothetical protein